MKVGYLGPKGTFSYEACMLYINCKEVETKEYKTIPDTIIAIENGEIDEAVVPIENSLQGCVTDAIDTLINYENIKVREEILLEIKQNLMSNKECKLEDLNRIYSHPQALAQCRNYLEKHGLLDKIEAVESTALAAKKVAEESFPVACICNMSCLEEYGLNLIDKSIQDNDFNKTKFWVLSKEENKDTKSKMSMLFSVKDKPGALYNVLKIFNEYDLNLTKIESRPAKTVLGEYIFWIDVTIKDSNYIEAIEKINDMGIYTRILGIY